MTTLPTAVICTPLDVEHQAVYDLLDDRPFTEETRGGTVYELTELEGLHTRWRLVLNLTGRYNEDASAAVERAAAAWNPKILLLVGIAGGLRDAEIGDVVAAKKVYGYDSGQDTDEGFRSRLESLPTSHALDQQAQRVRREAAWIKRAEPETAVPPQVFHRPIASGNKVVTGTGSRTAELIRQHCGDASAVDMEGFGAMTAASRNSDVQAMVIRGISDLLDGKTKLADRSNQPMAARRAAAFALTLIERCPPDFSRRSEPAADTNPDGSGGKSYVGAIGHNAVANIGALGDGSHGQVIFPDPGRWNR